MKNEMQYHGMFQIGQRETVSFNLHRAKPRIIITGVCFFAFFFVLLLFFLHSRNGDWLLSLVSGLPISLAIGLMAAYVRMFLLVQKINRAFSSGSLRPFVQNVQMNSSGLSVLSGSIRTVLKWKNLLKYQETKHAFYLYFPDRQSYYLPKSQMKNDGDSEVVRCILKSAKKSS